VRSGFTLLTTEPELILPSHSPQSFLTYLKGYMKKTKAALQAKADGGNDEAKERLAKFETGAAAFAKKMIGNFKDYEFFTGESMDPDGMVVMMNYREDGITPYMIFWKDGLREVSHFQSHNTTLELSLKSCFCTSGQGLSNLSSFFLSSRSSSFRALCTPYLILLYGCLTSGLDIHT
jgi:hypothetical protein